MHPLSSMPFEKQSRLRPVDIELIPCFGHPFAKDPLLPFFNAENRLRFYRWCHVIKRVPASLFLYPWQHEYEIELSLLSFSLNPIPAPWKKALVTLSVVWFRAFLFLDICWWRRREGGEKACHRIVCRYYDQSFITPSKSLFYDELSKCPFSHGVEKGEYKYLGFGIRDGCLRAVKNTSDRLVKLGRIFSANKSYMLIFNSLFSWFFFHSVGNK